MNIRTLFKYQKELLSIFKHINLLTGQILLTESMLNNDFRDLMLTQLSPTVTNYSIKIINGHIDMNVGGSAKGVRFNSNYRFTIEDFIFTPGLHRISLSVKEQSLGADRLIDKIILGLLKVILTRILGKSFLEIGLNSRQGINVDGNTVTINLDEIPEFLSLRNKTLGKTNTSIISLIKLDLVEVDHGKIIFQLDYPEFMKGINQSLTSSNAP